jgi:hypothetical protein
LHIKEQIKTMSNSASASTGMAGDGTRKFQEPPPALGQGFRYHHIGIPTKTRHTNEHFLPGFKVWASGFATSPYGVEWLRFEADSPVPTLVQSVPHVAFAVDDLDAAIAGKEVIFPPFTPYDGVRAAMIMDNGAPVEMLEFRQDSDSNLSSSSSKRRHL